MAKGGKDITWPPLLARSNFMPQPCRSSTCFESIGKKQQMVNRSAILLKPSASAPGNQHSAADRATLLMHASPHLSNPKIKGRFSTMERAGSGSHQHQTRLHFWRALLAQRR